MMKEPEAGTSECSVSESITVQVANYIVLLVRLVLVA